MDIWHNEMDSWHVAEIQDMAAVEEDNCLSPLLMGLHLLFPAATKIDDEKNSAENGLLNEI